MSDEETLTEIVKKEKYNSILITAISSVILLLLNATKSLKFFANIVVDV